MPRPKEFDTDLALERAMDVFWLKGYEATSLQDLVDHIGVGRQSLYNAFGGKHELFLAALDRYCNSRLGRGLEMLESQDASLETIRAFCDMAVKGFASDPRSCFLANSTLELACRDKEVSIRAKNYTRRMEKAFFHAISNAIERGECRPAHKARSLARHMTNCICGLTVLTKTEVSQKELLEAMAVSLSVLG